MISWLEGEFEPLRISDLPEYSAQRINNIQALKEYEKKIAHSIGWQLTTDYSTVKTLNQHVEEAVNQPSTWLQQKQLVDDFIQ